DSSIGLAASGTGDIKSFTALNGGSVPLVATITVTPHYDDTAASCVGSSKAFTITVNPRPTALVSGDGTICNGESTPIQAVLSGAGPWNVTWSDGATQTGLTSSPATRDVSPTSTTTYKVTALSDSNCTAQPGDLTGSAVVTVNPRPTAVLSGSGTICNG